MAQLDLDRKYISDIDLGISRFSILCYLIAGKQSSKAPSRRGDLIRAEKIQNENP